MLKKLFTKPKQDKETMTQESHTDRARALVKETVKKIKQAERDLADSEIAYSKALQSGDDSRCLAELENQDNLRRNLKLLNDKLPLHEAAIAEAEKKDAAPEIAAQCIAAQRLCDEEAKLIEAYVLA